MGTVVTLSAAERAFAMNIVPTKGNMLVLRTAQDVLKKLAITEQEGEEIGLRFEDGQTFWEPNAHTLMKDIEFTSAETGMLKDVLMKKESADELEMNEVSLFEKIVEGGK